MTIDKEKFKQLRAELAKVNDNSETKVTEPIEMMTELSKVKSSIKENVTEDYILAHTIKAERDFITENYENAEYAKSIIKRYGDKGYKYEWDAENLDWKRNDEGIPIKFPLKEQEIEKINKMSTRTFEFFMIKPHMITVLNRNNKENFMVKLMGKSWNEEEEKQTVGEMDSGGFMDRIMERIRGQEEVEE